MTNSLDFKHIKGKTKRGLKYIIFKDDNTLSVSIYIMTSAGVIFEKKPGLAHFTEHVFVGLSTKKENKDTRIKNMEIHGIYKNAWTSYETISYGLDAPYTQMDYAFKVLGDDFTQAKFDPKEIEIERNVIKDEIAKSNNNIFANLFNYELSNFFKKGDPYTHKVLGTAKELDKITIEDLKEHYKLLNNKNMVIGVSGNVNEEKVIKLIERFSELLYKSKGKEKEINPKYRTPEYKKPEDIVIKPSKLSKNTVFAISKIYKESSKERKLNKKQRLYLAAVNDIVINTFAQAQSSYLWKALRENSGLVYGYWFDVWRQENFSLIDLTLDVPKENVEKVLKKVNEETKKLLKGNMSKKEVEYWKNYTKNKLMLSTTEHKKILPALVKSFFYSNYTFTPKELLKAQEKIKKEDVNKFLKKLKEDIKKEPFVAVFTGNTKGINKSKIRKLIKFT